MRDGQAKYPFSRFGVSAVGASLAAHSVAAAMLFALPAVSSIELERVRDIEVAIEVEALPAALPPAPPPPDLAPLPEEPEVTPPEPPDPDVAPPTPPPDPRLAPPILGPTDPVVEGPPPSGGVIEVPDVTPDATPRETPAERERRIAALLDPTHAASTMMGSIVGPIDTGPRRSGGTHDVAPGVAGAWGVTAQTEAEAERGLRDHLRERAMAKAYLARTRPELRRRADGSQVYEGHAFTATVRPDGSVEFSDRPAVQTEGFSTSGSFDLTDLFMQAGGQDPYAAERQWFMDHTEEMRDRLDEEHRRTTMESGLRRLRGRLRRLWEDIGRTPEERRRLIFREWDDADSGGQETIEEWVRRELPSGSDDAYPASELRSLNSSRSSSSSFSPY